jgi:hypothetical protein
MTMRTVFVWMGCVAALGISAGTASAQYGTRSMGSTTPGEDYHVEVAYNFWTPERDIVVASESLGIVGSRIDAVEDLGFEQETFGDFRLVLRPSRKFKFRLGYTPIKYEAESVLTRTIVFNGQRYDVGLPVNSTLDWKAWRFGLQYDFIYRERGFLGFVAEAKYTDVNVDLTSPIGSLSEFTSVKAPIPTIGLAGRAYLAEKLAINGEITGLKLNYDENEGTYLDYDISAIFNINNYVGVQGGYRSLTVEYLIDADQGDFNLKGLYFGGTLRF